MDVIITRQPINYIKQGVIDTRHIKDIHWGNISGGVKVPTADAFLYGYIPYDMAVDLVDCSGEHLEGYGNNSAKVCILKGLNEKNGYTQGYQECYNRAGERPSSWISQNRPVGKRPCTKQIIEVLNDLHKTGEKEVTRKEFKKIIVDELGYPNSTFCSAMKTLNGDGRIKITGSFTYHHQVISLNYENEKVKDFLQKNK